MGGCGPPKRRFRYRPPPDASLPALSALATEEASSSSLLVFRILRGVAMLMGFLVSITKRPRLGLSTVVIVVS